jgi:hypothetical protein
MRDLGRMTGMVPTDYQRRPRFGVTGHTRAFMHVTHVVPVVQCPKRGDVEYNRNEDGPEAAPEAVDDPGQVREAQPHLPVHALLPQQTEGHVNEQPRESEQEEDAQSPVDRRPNRKVEGVREVLVLDAPDLP